MTRETSNKIFYVCRCLLGLMFILSAVLKFISLGAFESYVFSLDFFNLTVSSYLSRCLLLAEASLGCLLISTLYKRVVDLLTLFMLIGFSGLLLYLLLIGEDGNCHCMGESFSLSPAASLLKNGVLFLLLFFAVKCEPFNVPYPRVVLALILLSSLVFAFVKLPLGWGTPRETKFNVEAYAQLEQTKPELMELKEKDVAVVCFFSVKCKHCKMAMRKLEVCLKNATVQPAIQWIVWGDEKELQAFEEETGVAPQSHFFMDPVDMMPITEYNIPLIVIYNKGEMKLKMSNATFDDEACRKLLSVK